MCLCRTYRQKPRQSQGTLSKGETQMYLVVSRWKAKPGKEDMFESQGKNARASLRSQPGVKMVESFMGEDGAVVVHGYEDEAAYNRIINDPNGHFAKMAE